MKKDIEHKEDIKAFVDVFYARLLEDPLLRPIFLDVAGINLADHLPIIYDFWDSVLFQTGTYRGDTLEKHLELHMEQPLGKKHFDQWLQLFNETLNDFFTGKKAHEAKQKARSIATVMKIKIDDLERRRKELNN